MAFESPPAPPLDNARARPQRPDRVATAVPWADDGRARSHTHLDDGSQVLVVVADGDVLRLLQLPLVLR
eukprot:CAMPEP_0183558680 /NCGR_PEP_ID=MMETSP0371-20130417/89435_1 /TAXON_ID=268820 /ORGANISM="Peridinium aciculiferum, Strain PAER-2" /LENGTH=68 /DNA_ID=CAMNT_0025766187 /DNA_START=16 /DNA_END=220 /DNA_ORIENTATION=+